MLKKFLLALVLLIALGLVVAYFSYSTFRSEQLAQLEAHSLIVETKLGSIEYSLSPGTDPVLLFLHGSPGGYDQEINVPGMRVLTPSRPGYLRTPLSVGATPEAQADAYAALLDALYLESVVVMGASGGGPSAISFAARYPARTRALIAMEAVSQPFALAEIQEPPAFMRSDFSMWAMLALTDRFMGDQGIVGLLIPDVQIQQRVLANEDSVRKLRSLFWSIWPPSLRATGLSNDMAQFADLQLPATEVQAPTLIVHGTEDINVPIAHSEALAQQVPNAEFAIVKGADHMMPYSHADEVDRTVAEFLRRTLPDDAI